MLAIGQKLDQLADLHRQVETLERDKQKLIDQVLTPEIKARLDEIEAEFTQKAETAQASIEALEGQIKADTLSHGETVRGAAFQAVWTKGRTSWDSKGLAGYADSHPELLQFRKEGEPSVTIRKMSGKEAE
jgi:hypothetical protein